MTTNQSYIRDGEPLKWNISNFESFYWKKLKYNRVPPVYTIYTNVLWRQHIRNITTNIFHGDRTRADRFIYIYLNNVGTWKALTTVNRAFSGPVVDRKDRTTASMHVHYNGCTAADVNLQVMNGMWTVLNIYMYLRVFDGERNTSYYSYSGVSRYLGYFSRGLT